MPQKLDLTPLDLTPIDDEPEAISDAPASKPKSSFLSSFWDAINEPLVNLSPMGRSISESITEPSLSDADSYFLPRIKGFVGGATEGLSDVLSSFTSPLNLATAGAFGGATAAARRGLPAIGRGLQTVGRGLSAPVAAHGASEVLGPESTPSERAFGVAELAGGLAGIRSPKLAMKSKATTFADEVVPPKATEVVPEAIVTKATVPEVISESLPAKVADPEVSAILKKFGIEEAAPELATKKTADVPVEVVGEAKAKPVEQRVVYDHNGNRRVLSDIEAVDYEVQPGETYGIERGTDFISLNDLGGRVPEGARVIRPRRREYPGLVKPKITTDKTIAADLEASLNQRLDRVKSGEVPPQGEIPAEITKTVDESTADVPDKDGLIRRALSLNKSLLTSWDLSAPGRQGKAFILNKEWWTSLDDMVKAWGSKTAADNIHQSIIDHPSGFFKPGTGKSTKSFAEQVGLDLADNEEFFNSNVGKNVRKYLLVSKSSRAHTAFLNKLRSDVFVSFMKDAEELGRNPTQNLELARSYARFINNATGRGSLNVGSWKFENSAKAMNDMFFAPKNMSGQVRTWNAVLNPVSYVNYDPVLRKQALKSLFAIAGAGTAFSELAKLAGAEVSNDPTNPDFRKIKIGDTRIDPFGGYQQFPVAAAKLLTGESTSSITGKTTDLTAGKYGQQTRASVAERFFINRLAPLPSFIWAWMNNREFDGKPFEVKRAIFERVFPIAAKDVVELMQEDPTLAGALALPTLTGLTGTQTYSGR